MDSELGHADASTMPFPLNKIRRLGDYDGHWSLLLRCRCCQHRREVAAEFFIRLFGKQASISQIVPRLYCSNCRDKSCRCAARNFESLIGVPR